MSICIDNSLVTRTSIDDHLNLEDALEDWGGAEDPCAEAYRRGWHDYRAGRNNPPVNEADRCAYLSGYIAARETPID